MRNRDEAAGTRSTGSTEGAGRRTSQTPPPAPTSGATTTDAEGAAAPSSATTGLASAGQRASTGRLHSPNASADNILPAGTEAHVVQDAIYGQPSGPVMARSDRVEREEILRRRTTPAEFAATKERHDAEAAAARANEQK